MTHTPLSTQQLDEIAASDKAATPGPWTVELEQCDCSDGLCHHGTYVGAVYADGERRTEITDFPDADWQFVIRARTAVPALLADVMRLRAQARFLLAALSAQGVRSGDAEEALRAFLSADPDDDDPEFVGTRPCGHDDYHDPHEWHGRPGTWCPGISTTDAEPAARPVAAADTPTT